MVEHSARLLFSQPVVELNTALLFFTLFMLLSRAIPYTKINYWLILW
ncbi:hypothetical protein yberc0001_10310 [Yersinia bercovieri ATCC 43970]|uniref:Uncharacterized protein n=1 Tax=Yersinia bercovieri ATCC 43970 TaxID=349968 RepID=A0ABM9Y3V0_YERBE|nr:hypothetical protein yberc0001_10310 [Yersinia bercovieri ATCC 43970]